MDSTYDRHTSPDEKFTVYEQMSPGNRTISAKRSLTITIIFFLVVRTIFCYYIYKVVHLSNLPFHPRHHLGCYHEDLCRKMGIIRHFLIRTENIVISIT